MHRVSRCHHLPGLRLLTQSNGGDSRADVLSVVLAWSGKIAQQDLGRSPSRDTTTELVPE